VVDSGGLDAIVGEVLPDVPFVHAFDLSYQAATAGEVVRIPSAVFHVNDDDIDPIDAEAMDREFGPKIRTEVVWVRVNPETRREAVVDLDAHEYTLTDDDVGNQIKAVIYPLDVARQRCPPTESTPTPVVARRERVKVIGSIVGELRVGQRLDIHSSEILYSVQWMRTKAPNQDPVVIRESTFHRGDRNRDLFLYARAGEEPTRDVSHCLVKVVLGRWSGGQIVPRSAAHSLYLRGHGGSPRLGAERFRDEADDQVGGRAGRPEVARVLERAAVMKEKRIECPCEIEILLFPLSPRLLSFHHEKR
jgi:hypothetical protein